jgi:hypothetical protein
MKKTYRHSLLKETEALRTVVSAATAGKGASHLSPSLATLKKLNDAGLLEAYILLAIADDGIAKDYPAYLRTNRDNCAAMCSSTSSPAAENKRRPSIMHSSPVFRTPTLFRTEPYYTHFSMA